MARSYQAVPVTRAGTALSGSPFSVRIYVAAFRGQRHEVVPDAAKTMSSVVLSFADIASGVAVGDLATLPDGRIARIANRRSYDRSLQCDLQIIPFVPVRRWVIQPPSSPTLDPADVAFSDMGLILTFLEPSDSLDRLTPVGRLDLRTCRAYTLAPLTQGDILVDSNGVGWSAVTASQSWGETGDLRAVVRRLDILPAGVGA